MSEAKKLTMRPYLSGGIFAGFIGEGEEGIFAFPVMNTLGPLPSRYEAKRALDKWAKEKKETIAGMRAFRDLVKKQEEEGGGDHEEREHRGTGEAAQEGPGMESGNLGEAGGPGEVNDLEDRGGEPCPGDGHD